MSLQLAKYPRPLSALIVEDCETSRTLLQCYLEALSVSYRATHCGINAIEAATDPSINLVLTDLNLGGISGTDVIQRIKRFRTDVEFIGMSASNEPAVAAKFRACGANGFILKPYNLNIISTAIEQAKLHFAKSY